MNNRFRNGLLVLLLAGLVAGVALAGVAVGQEKKAPQTAGVDDTKMGAYRALAQLSFAAIQKGDTATAAKLARILERNWDKAEDYGGDTALSKTNHALFEQIDKSMDTFINSLGTRRLDIGFKRDQDGVWELFG